MKPKTLTIAAIVFFLCLNTMYFWQFYLGSWDMLTTLILLVTFLVLSGYWLYYLFLLIREKFTNRPRLLAILVLTAVLGLTFLFPAGINFEKWEGEDWVVAGIEGAANCTTTFRLKTNKRFTEESVCFGVTRNRGTYTIKNDTLFLSYKQEDKWNYQYGKIQSDTMGKFGKNRELLLLYGSGKDPDRKILFITYRKDKQ